VRVPKASRRKEYRGLNSLLLGMREYSSRYWVAYKQAQKSGGNVEKGEKATPDEWGAPTVWRAYPDPPAPTLIECRPQINPFS
jgi:antirestriction factor ArdC-like protein